ncbi:acyltransferase [Methanobrevibacter sp.]|uniref:acyltransferase n=1 Tax=Methanobrevibacter sp. TaxID=66852 RepID=UPI00388DC3B7
MATKTKSKRIFYFDALRALAISSVIIFHIFLVTRGNIAPEYPLHSFNWFFCDITGVCFRCGVDLFLVLSGALSLGREWDIKSFLGKRLPRIVMPFLFWGIVLTLIAAVLCICFPALYNMIDPVNLPNYFKYLIGAFLANSYGFGPYWFFWMILGTYLIMPIFNKWLLHADLKEAEYFLVFWLITCLFTYTLKMEFPITLTYFTGPIGMVVLGYYLRHTERKIFNNPYFSLFIFIISNVLLVAVSYLQSDVHHIKYFDRYSIYIAFQTIGIVLLFKNFGKFNIKSRIIDKIEPSFKILIFSIAKYSYGIYLIHQFVLRIVFQKFFSFLPYKILLVVYFVGILGTSLIIMALLNRIPYVNQVIGAK